MVSNPLDSKSKKPATGGIGSMLTQVPYKTSSWNFWSNLQIVMCSNVRPDFNTEEVASVEKDQKELDIIVEDMADHLPIEDPSKGNSVLK